MGTSLPPPGVTADPAGGLTATKGTPYTTSSSPPTYLIDLAVAGGGDDDLRKAVNQWYRDVYKGVCGI